MAFLRNTMDAEGLYINNDRVPTIEELYSLKQEAYHYYHNQNNDYMNYASYHYPVPPPIKIEPKTDIEFKTSELNNSFENKANSSSSSHSSNNSLDVITTQHTNHKYMMGSNQCEDRSLTDQLNPDDDDDDDMLLIVDRIVDDVAEDQIEELQEKPLKQKYICAYCSASFATINLRKQHESNHHTGAKLYKCNNCEMYFATHYRRKVHEIKHGTHCPYICSHCGDRFKSQYKRQVHERVHSDQQPYRCQYCGENFATRYRKNTHEVGHISDTPYECRYCDKAFKTPYRCKQHEVGHAGNKYRCQFCEESFKTAHKRYIHILSHSGLVHPYQCPKCPQSDKSTSYRTAYKLRAHLATVHRFKPTDMRQLAKLTSQRNALVPAATTEHIRTESENGTIGNVEREQVNYSTEFDYLKTQPDDELVTCFSCNAIFGNKLHLIAHIRSMHTFTFL